MRPASRPRADHLVRPRWVWGGLALALAGAGTLAYGVTVLAWPPSIIGVGLLVLGTAASLRGGVLHDAASTLSARQELRQVREGDVHPGIAAGDTLDASPARRDAVATNRAARAREVRARHTGDVHWAPVAGWLLLLVTAVLTVSQWELVAASTTGRGNGVRDTVAAIVVGLAGMRLALVPGRHPIVAGITGLAGAALVLTGLLGEHDHPGLAVVQAASGGLVVACALVAAVSPAPTR